LSWLFFGAKAATRDDGLIQVRPTGARQHIMDQPPGVANRDSVGRHKFSGMGSKIHAALPMQQGCAWLASAGNCRQEYGFSRQAVLTDPYPFFDL
jgi:hypothetical protein